jgi:dolichyl-phosphate-mannose--protein O-mannosyl transferase
MTIGRTIHLLPLMFGGLAMHWIWDLCLRHPTAAGITGAIVVVVVIVVVVIGQGAMSTVQNSDH